MTLWPEPDVKNGKLVCGCCGRKTIVVLADGLARLCGCDPDQPTCHQCSRGRCHCRCVPARTLAEPALPGVVLDPAVIA